jgi:hypothetical protein
VRFLFRRQVLYPTELQAQTKIKILSDSEITNCFFLILFLYAVRTNKTKARTTAAEPDKDWQKTQYSNLICYVPSGTYYARLRVKGKLIRRSLKTDVLSVAKLCGCRISRRWNAKARRTATRYRLSDSKSLFLKEGSSEIKERHHSFLV